MRYSWFLILLLTLIGHGPAFAVTCPEIPSAEAKARIESLSKDIRHHNRLYYLESRSVISDAEYDRMYAELVRLEECFPALAVPDSPTWSVGSADRAGNLTVKHERPMLSLSSSTGPDAVEALMRRAGASGVRFIVQPKVDGLPVELIYENGLLVSASTRGDGFSGENVTARIHHVPGIPLVLSGTFPSRVVVRGEVYADRRYAKGSTSSNEKYSTLRHLAAATLRSQYPDSSALAVLRFFPFELVNADSITNAPSSDSAALKFLSDWTFTVPAEHTRPAFTLAEVKDIYRDYLAHRDQQPFAMDGIVVKVDDHALRRRLGEGARAPFWAAAWKFPPVSALTRVREIQWKVGRTGRRTPVAEIDPVRLGGVRVKRVSLHNAEEIARLDIAAGDQVIVGLVGDVIPQVLEVADRVPRAPGFGHHSVKLQKPAVDVCLSDGPGCREQFLARLVHFTSKQGLNIPGFGQGRLQMLVEAGLVHDIPSLYLLKVQDIAKVPGFGEKTARQLTAAILDASHPDEFDLLAALGCLSNTRYAVRDMSRQFACLQEIIDAEEERLNCIAGSRKKAVISVREFFRSPGGADLLDKFHGLGMLQNKEL